ncbi:hypothetical protein [Enterococcus hirae]|uniref:hypothetical protein n=1 Tax=Enterococcus hirae TaxID=1354 RepID=UPI00136CF8D3|nr:hypothetical protein [Enterococcus hirae]NAE18213.1 hypothetical protein [Enterococcus hirae]
MSWARLDDRWHDHPKVVAAGLEAAGLWTMCLTWAHQARKSSKEPGVVPVEIVVRFAGPKAKRLAAKLVSTGLFDERTDAGWPIHDFNDYLAKYDSDQAREAGRRGGLARAAKQTASEPLDEPPSKTPGGGQANEQQTPSTRASVRRNPDPDPLKNTPSPDGSGAFDAFWSAYPRKVGKDAARKAWNRAVKRSSVEDVMAGLQHWLPLARETEERFRPYPATWLNEGRWKDESEARAASPSGGGEWTDEALDDYLGPDRWQLPIYPDGVNPGTPEFSAWVGEQRSLRRQERVVEANRRMNLRVAR